MTNSHQSEDVTSTPSPPNPLSHQGRGGERGGESFLAPLSPGGRGAGGEGEVDIASYNESSLKALVRAIRFAQGQFRLILARCNYGALRDRMVQQLRELSPVEIRELVLPKSVKTLYTTIKAELGNEVPQVLIVFGLESVSDIKTVLTSSNYIREEFSQHFSFPLVLWVNDEVLKKLLRLAPDLESWATSIEFKLSTDALLGFLQQKVERIISDDLTTPRWICASVNLESCSELEVAALDLQNRGQELEPEVEASLEFVLGLDDYANNQIDAALEHYQPSLAFWQQNHNLERQGRLLINIGICYYRKAEQHLLESQLYWERSRDYLQQGIDVFAQAQRPELVAEHISKLCEILRRLQAWEQLQALAQQALTLHQTYGNQSQLAQDYGCLAEVALEQSHWAEAKQLARQALQILSTIPNRPTDEGGLYWFILGRSQEHLQQLQEAVSSLEQARKENNPQYEPQLSIDILGKLRELYFQQGEYLKAFEIKRERSSIEYQYGFQAFVGAAYLHPKRQVINPALAQTGQQSIIVREIAASGREQDVKRLIERIRSTHHKLIVIHGQSGVGKSSILKAGLISALKQQAIAERDALPVLNRYYTNWVRELGRLLAEALEKTRGVKLSEPLDSVAAITAQLRKNADRNLVTVLIFDQFEEFFFAAREKTERRHFFEFLQECLNIGFVKVILSLREDYLHYLLESERFINLDAINGNILDKNIRYPLGNFSPEEAKAVIQSLTERSQFYLQPELIDELVRDLAGELREVRPIELQVVGAQLQDDNIRTLEQYRRLGANPKAELVELYLKGVIKDCGEENKEIAQLILYLLTDENNTRPLKTRAELAASLESKADKLDLVLKILVGSGLVVRVPESPADRYQLVHDYLVEFIRQQQGAERLAELQKEKERRILGEQRFNRFLKRALMGSFAAIVGLAGLTWQAESQRRRAEKLQVGQSETLTRYSEELFNQDKDIEALLAGLQAGISLKRVGKGKVDGLTQVQLANILWQALRGKIATLRGDNSSVYSVSFSPDGKTLASASGDNTVKLWQVATGKPLTTLTEHDSSVDSVSFSPDGKTLASGSSDKTVKLWEVATGKPLTTLRGHDSYVYSVSFSPDGKTLASGSEDNTVKLWEVATGKPLTTLRGHDSSVISVSFSPDGKTLASGSDDKTVKLWEVATGKPLTTLRGHDDSVYSVSFSPDGKTLASASWDNTVKLWEVATGKPLTTLTGHGSDVISVSFSPDGKTLASGSGDNTVKLWGVATGKPLTTLTGHDSYVYSVSFSPDGKTLASASGDNTVKLWQVATGKPLTTLTGHDSSVISVSFSPDGKTLASGSHDKTVKLWQVATGKPLTTLRGHDDSVYSVSFSPDGKTLASASWDNRVKLWKLDLNFDDLLARGCDWGREYLENSPNVSDRTLCDGISPQK